MRSTRRVAPGPEFAGFRFPPEVITPKPRRHTPGDRWFVDETYVKVDGRWRYLYRAVDQFGQVVDVLVSPNRDQKPARRFFTRELAGATSPAEVTIDREAACPRVLDELLPASRHVTVRFANNRVEPTTAGSRPGCGPCAA